MRIFHALRHVDRIGYRIVIEIFVTTSKVQNRNHPIKKVIPVYVLGNTHHCWYVRVTNSSRVFAGLTPFLPVVITMF